jgi:hypothetical protein
MVTLLWKLMSINEEIFNGILRHDRVNEIAGPVLYLMSDSIGEVSNVSILNICLYLLLKLSQER